VAVVSDGLQFVANHVLPPKSGRSAGAPVVAAQELMVPRKLDEGLIPRSRCANSRPWEQAKRAIDFTNHN
jgi:hypothetical protein